MNKRLIFEEVSRMHTLMGVKSNKVVSLLKEDISTGFARILGDFIKGVERNAGELELNGILKSLNPDERKLIDEFADDVKAKTGKDFGFKSVDDLVSVAGKLDVYKALASTIKSNSDTFFKTLGKKFNLNSLPVVLTQKQQVDQIMSKLLASADENQKYVINLLQKGETESLLPAQRKIFADQLRKINDPEGVAKQMADQFESSYKIIDDVETELGAGAKTVDVEYDEWVFDEVSGEWVSKAEKEASDAAKGADEAGGDAAKGADEASDDAGIDDFWKKIDAEEETGGTTPIVEITTKELQDKYRKLYEDSPTDFTLLLDDLRGRIKNLKSGDKLTKDDIALLDIAGSNGLIGKNDPIYLYINKNILRDPTVVEIQDLIKNHNAWKKSGGDMTFNDYCRKNNYTPPGWFKHNVAAKGLNVVEGYLGSWQRTYTRIDESGETVSWKQYFKDLGVIISSSLLLAGTAISVFTDLDDVILKTIYKADPMQKEQITKNLTEYFTYTSPIVIVDGKQFNIYDPKLGKNNPNFTYKTQTPNPDFTLGNVDKLEFGLEPGLVVSGRTFNIFRLNPQNEKLIGGSEIFGKAHTLTALDTGAQGVSTSTTTTTGGKVADETGVSNFLATTPTKPTIEAKTLKLVEKGTDGIDKYTVNLVLPNGDKYAGYKLKFNTKDGTWASNQ
jgi:hypothetical protein